MDQKQMAITAKRMTEARANLVRDNPFFGHLALGLQLSCAPCGTACTDGERLIFDPGFAEQLTEKELEFVTLHEVLHCVLEHCTRGNSLNQELFNIACDIVVNSTILEMWGMDSFQVAGEDVMHLAPNGTEGRNCNAEEIYHMLLRQGRTQANKAGGGKPQSGTEMQTIDRHDIWQTIEQKDRIRDSWNRQILKAASTCQGMGSLTSSVRALAESLLHRSETDWRQLLHDFVQHDIYDYSFLPPDRRFSDSDFFLPAFNIDPNQSSVHDIWVCVDASGSITDNKLAEAMAEIQNAMSQTGLTGAISFFDWGITEPEPFETEEEFHKIIPKGGGGTSFHVIFNYLREHLLEDPPRAILIFTDGYAHWPKEESAMGIPVLWLIRKGGNVNAPWGRVAKL